MFVCFELTLELIGLLGGILLSFGVGEHGWASQSGSVGAGGISQGSISISICRPRRTWFGLEFVTTRRDAGLLVMCFTSW